MKISPALVFNFFLNIIFITLSIFKLSGWRSSMLGAGIILILLYGSWSMIESVKSHRKKVEQIQSTYFDQKTFDYYFITRLFTIYSALLIPTIWVSPGPWIYIGIAFFVIGILLRLTAMKTLGEFYSHWVRLKDDHRVTDRGPYKIIRHPSYLGMLLGILGFVIFFFNLISILLYCLLFVPSIVRRIGRRRKSFKFIEGL